MHAHPVRSLRNHSTILFIVGLATILSAAFIAANIGRQSRAIAARVPPTTTSAADRERFAEHKQRQAEQVMDAAMPAAAVLAAPTTPEQFRALKEQRAQQAMDAAMHVLPHPTTHEELAWLKQLRARQIMDAATHIAPSRNPAAEHFAAMKQRQTEQAMDR